MDKQQPDCARDRCMFCNVEGTERYLRKDLCEPCHELLAKFRALGDPKPDCALEPAEVSQPAITRAEDRQAFEQWWNRPVRPMHIVVFGERDKEMWALVWCRAWQAAIDSTRAPAVTPAPDYEQRRVFEAGFQRGFDAASARMRDDFAKGAGTRSQDRNQTQRMKNERR
jgi:hypothetical protein